MTALVAYNDDFNNSLVELEQTQKMCASLMKTPHYAKMGEVGIFTIVQKARSVGLNPLDALNGSMYFVNGKVELSANTMNYMIRSKGHSITKDPKSNRQICILHGKRADNGDTWISSFSIEEAKQAGIYKNTWEKYPEDMLFARALTRLARQLFPDVTKGCYVEGEIRDAVEADKVKPFDPSLLQESDAVEEKITLDQAKQLSDVLDSCDPKYKERVLDQLKKKYPPITKLIDLTPDLFNKIYELAQKASDEHQRKISLIESTKESEEILHEAS